VCTAHWPLIGICKTVFPSATKPYGQEAISGRDQSLGSSEHMVNETSRCLDEQSIIKNASETYSKGPEFFWNGPWPFCRIMQQYSSDSLDYVSNVSFNHTIFPVTTYCAKCELLVLGDTICLETSGSINTVVGPDMFNINTMLSCNYLNFMFRGKKFLLIFTFMNIMHMMIYPNIDIFVMFVEGRTFKQKISYMTRLRARLIFAAADL
jgi:hypothetical protein